jgi:glutathionylspermidine synthase
MDHLFLGINFPAPRNYERVRVENVNFNENVEKLIEKFRELTGNKDEISLAYLGNILEDNEPINRYLRAGSTVHILKKSPEDVKKDYKKFTELDVSTIAARFRMLNSGNFHVSFHTIFFFLQMTHIKLFIV